MTHTHTIEEHSNGQNLHLIKSNTIKGEQPEQPQPLNPGLYEQMNQAIHHCEESARHWGGRIPPQDKELWKDFARYVANWPNPDRDAYESFVRYISPSKGLTPDSVRERMSPFWLTVSHLLQPGSGRHLTDGNMLLSNAIAEYLDERRTARDLSNIRSKLHTLLNWCESRPEPILTVNLTASQMGEHFVWLEYEKPITAGRRKGQRGLEARSLENHRIILHRFFQWVVAKGWKADNPVQSVRKYVNDRNDLKAATPLSQDQLRQVLDSLSESDFRQLRDKLLIMYMYDFGRRCEIERVQLKDLDLDRPGTIKVWSKWGRKRDLQPSKQTVALMKRYLRERSKFLSKKREQLNRQNRLRDARELEHGYLFVSTRTGMPLTANAAYRAVKKAAERAGISNIIPSRLRKAAAGNYIANGGTHDELRHLMNHRYLSTTQCYTAGARKKDQPALPTDRLYEGEVAS